VQQGRYGCGRSLSSRDLEGQRFLAKTIFIAGGMGSFQPRLLRLEGLDAHIDRQMFYRVRDPSQFAGKHLVIVGGGDSALDWTLNFRRRRPAPRGEPDDGASARRLLGAPASAAKMKESGGRGPHAVRHRPADRHRGIEGRLTGVQITTP
jgi:thioredoxin reductase (NADPH)